MSYLKLTIINLACFVLLIQLSACSPKNPYPINDNLRFNNEGILVISTKNICNFVGPTGVPMYYVRSIDNIVNFRVVGDTVTSKEFITECSTLDFYNLPTGEYEIYSWKVAKATTFSNWREKPKDEFSIKFIVQPNKVNYLGQIYLESNNTISFSDMKERDLKVFYERYPAIPNHEVIFPIDFNYQLSDYGEILSTEKEGVYLPIMLPVHGGY